MKVYSRVILLILLVFNLIGKANAQNDSISTFSVSTNLDLMSRYVWRGQQYGNGPSIQPGLTLNWKDFTIGAWGAYEVFSEGSQETDFYLSKSVGIFTFEIWDYWTYVDNEKSDFLDYSKNSTSHLLEAQLMVAGNEKIPFNLIGSYFFYGADPSNSMYFEIQYTKSLINCDLLLFAGYQATGSFYAEKPSFVNVGATISKDIVITERFTLPMVLSLIFNPEKQNVQIVAGISL